MLDKHLVQLEKPVNHVASEIGVDWTKASDTVNQWNTWYSTTMEATNHSLCAAQELGCQAVTYEQTSHANFSRVVVDAKLWRKSSIK